MINIFTIYFSLLRKSELRALVNKFVAVLSQFDVVALKIKFFSDQLTEVQSQLQLLEVPASKHPLSDTIGNLRQDRKKLIRAILTQVRALNSAGSVYSIPQLNLVSSFVSRYLINLTDSNTTIQSDVLAEMFGKIESDNTLQSALESTGVKPMFDELKTLETNLQLNIDDRNSSSTRQEVQTSEVRIQAEKTLRNLMTEIKLAQLKYTEQNYDGLIEELNKVISTIMTAARLRNTVEKKKTSAKQDAEKTATAARNGNSDAAA